MSRILVIEPYRLLQYALAAALCPDHELSIVKEIPETVKDVDLVIVDASALRERDLLSESDLESIRNGAVPVLWLGADDHGVPHVDRLKHVELPLDRETLKQALTVLQASSETATKSEATARSAGRAAKKPRVKAAKSSDVNSEANQNIVELVDVVEANDDDNDQMESVKKV